MVPLLGAPATAAAPAAAAPAAAATDSPPAGQRVRLLSWNVNGLRAALKRLNVTISQFLEGLGAGGCWSPIHWVLPAPAAWPRRAVPQLLKLTAPVPLAAGGRHHLPSRNQAAAV